MSQAITLTQVIGQDEVKGNLLSKLDTAKRQGWHVPHLLFVGPEGMGKMTVATAIAAELGAIERCGSAKCWQAHADFTVAFLTSERAAQY